VAAAIAAHAWTKARIAIYLAARIITTAMVGIGFLVTGSAAA
jgi:hypothetical protein